MGPAMNGAALLAAIAVQVPVALWFVPLALLPLVLRRSRVVTVASTAPWREVGATRVRARSGLLALLVLLLVLLAARPVSIRTPSATGAAVTATTVGGRPFLDVDLTRIPSLHPTSDATNDTTVELLLDDRSRTLGNVRGDSASFPLPEAVAGRVGTVVLRRATFEHTTHLRVPGGRALPMVEDRSGSAACARALAALVAGGRIVVAPPEDEIPDDDDARRTRIRIVTATGVPDPSDPEARAGLRIELPPEDAERTLFLPAIDPDLSSVLVRGLDPRRWAIIEATALPPPGGTPLVVDADGHVLVDRRGGTIRLAFRPEWTDLAEHPEWPVLLGRCLETLDPVPIPLSPTSRHPRALLLVAVGAVLLGLRGPRRTRIAIAIVAVVGSTLPAIPGVPAPRVPFAPTDAPPLPALERAIDRLAGGGTLVLPDGCAVPAELGRLADRLALRGVGLEPPSARSSTWTIDRRTVVLGRAIEVRGVAGTRIEVFSPASVVEDGGPSDVSPGNEARGETLVLDDAGRGRHEPSVPGVWLLRDADGHAIAVRVRPPIPVLPIGDSTTGARPLLDADERFELLPAVADPASLVARLAEVAQERAPGAVVHWDGARAEDLDPSARDALEAWLRAGGTLFTVAAPPFRGSEGPTALDALLPAPLPAPPRPPHRDHGILLLDLSGSVRDDTLETLWTGIAALLEGTPAEDRWAVAGFRERTTWILPPGAALDASAIERVRAAARTGGGTRLDRALTFAHEALLADPTLQRSILVLSDGRTSGAGWTTITDDLRTAGVRVSALALGTAADTSVLRPIVEGTGGSWSTAPDPATALTVLTELWRDPAARWQPVESPVIPVDPRDPRWPATIPGPLRRVESPLTTDASPRVVWAEASGAPLLLERAIGRGRALLLLTGLDAESLPAGPAAETFRGILLSGLARTVASTPHERRGATPAIDREGQGVTLVERLPGDPPRSRATLETAGGERSDLTALATIGDVSCIDAELPPGAAVSIEGIASAPWPGGRGAVREVWATLAARLPHASTRTHFAAGSLVLLLLALLLACRRLAGLS